MKRITPKENVTEEMKNKIKNGKKLIFIHIKKLLGIKKKKFIM